MNSLFGSEILFGVVQDKGLGLCKANLALLLSIKEAIF